MFHCEDYIIAVLATAFKIGESRSPNVKHCTTKFDIDDVKMDTQYLALIIVQSPSDEIKTTVSFKSTQTLYLL